MVESILGMNEFYNFVEYMKSLYLENDVDKISFLQFCVTQSGISLSQNFQDIWAIFETIKSSPSYPKHFIEFGATDGIAGSNTFLLENFYSWKGTLVEPIPEQYDNLMKNRKNANCLNACVWTHDAGYVDLIIPEEKDLSTIVGYGQSDEHANKRKQGRIISVPTISLLNVVKQTNPIIDYMSVDTEGSEYDILKAYFDNEESKNYEIKCISVEHNYQPEARQNIYNLLTLKGYIRKFEEISRWDDFYVLNG